MAKIPGTNPGLTALDAAVCSPDTGTLPLVVRRWGSSPGTCPTSGTADQATVRCHVSSPLCGQGSKTKEVSFPRSCS